MDIQSTLQKYKGKSEQTKPSSLLCLQMTLLLMVHSQNVNKIK